MNDDTYEEVVTFKLTRVSVYIGISVLFVLLVGLTVALIAFTPLKLYIPGYGNGTQGSEYQHLKFRTDSMEHSIVLKQQYLDNLQQVLEGKPMKKDTTVLKIKNAEKSTN